MFKKRLLIIGAGGNGRSAAEVAELSGEFVVVGFLDDALSLGQAVLREALLGGGLVGLSRLEDLER